MQSNRDSQLDCMNLQCRKTDDKKFKSTRVDNCNINNHKFDFGKPEVLFYEKNLFKRSMAEHCKFNNRYKYFIILYFYYIIGI